MLYLMITMHNGENVLMHYDRKRIRLQLGSLYFLYFVFNILFEVLQNEQQIYIYNIFWCEVNTTDTNTLNEHN